MYLNILERFPINEPFTICGISRGGLIPLTVLANRFKKKMIEIISIDTYNEATKELSDLNFHFSSLNTNRLEETILVIDDLIDSGKTMNAVINHIKMLKPNCKIVVAVLYINNDVKINQNVIFNEMKDPSVWIQFPYEI